MKISQRKTSQFLYTIKGSPLETVTSHIYLGVEIDDKMTWTLHCTKVKKKASQALVRRTQPRINYLSWCRRKRHALLLETTDSSSDNLVRHLNWHSLETRRNTKARTW